LRNATCPPNRGSSNRDPEGRRGQSTLDDVADRVAVLEATETWLAVHRGQLLSVLAAAED
jgi:hypothetical protein